jgi:citrate lyase beta subunit
MVAKIYNKKENKKKMSNYLFTKDINKNTPAYLKKCLKHNAVLCYDWEDSIEISNGIKNKKTTQLQIIASILKHLSKDEIVQLGFRINNNTLQSFKNDLVMLGELGAIKSLFIPKVETRTKLKNAIKLVNNCEKIIPIIETKMGMNNIDSILQINDKRIQKIAFGHCDFNLDNGNFPFHHQDSTHYWDWITTINTACVKHNKIFINSPVLQLDNAVLFNYTLQQNKTYSQCEGMVTLCMSQIIAANNAKKNKKISLQQTQSTMQKNNKEDYEKNKVQGRTFALTSNRIILSPHEYFNLKK